MFRTVFRGLAAAAIFLVFLACDGPLSGYYAKDAPPGEEDRVLFCGFVHEDRYEILLDENEDPILDADENPVLLPIPVKGGISVYVKGITASYAHLIDDRGEFSFYVPTKDAAGKEISQYTVVFTDIAPREDENGHRYRYVQTTKTYPLEDANEELPTIKKSSTERIKIELEIKAE
jgi:hypothetical protein